MAEPDSKIESTPDPPMLKILMLHGFTQSGTLFHSKSRALEKHLQRSLSPLVGGRQSSVKLVYPTAPTRVSSSDIPGYVQPTLPPDEPEQSDCWAWWRMDLTTMTYTHMEQGLELVAKTMGEEGPFLGVIGFSQGAALAAMVSSLLEVGRAEAFGAGSASGGMSYPESFKTLAHPPLKFCISYSGFKAPHSLYAAFYEPPIETPMLHFIGSLDTVVDESRSTALIECCKGLSNRANGANVVSENSLRQKRVIYHPGGHFLPSQKPLLNVVSNFISETLQSTEPKVFIDETEDDVTAMDVPF